VQKSTFVHGSVLVDSSKAQKQSIESTARRTQNSVGTYLKHFDALLRPDSHNRACGAKVNAYTVHQRHDCSARHVRLELGAEPSLLNEFLRARGSAYSCKSARC
jgi:hypothetical protein